MTAQANRITGNMIEKYGTIPEFLWKKLKGHGVFRIRATINGMESLCILIKVRLYAAKVR